MASSPWGERLKVDGGGKDGSTGWERGYLLEFLTVNIKDEDLETAGFQGSSSGSYIKNVS